MLSRIWCNQCYGASNALKNMVQSMLWRVWCNQCFEEFDWLMITYIALFSALLSRLTALACGSTWVTSFLWRIFLISTEEYGAVSALRNMVQSIHLVNMEKVNQYNAVPNQSQDPAFRYNHSCVTVRCNQCYGPSNALKNMIQSMLWRVWCNQCFEEYGAINPFGEYGEGDSVPRSS